MVNRITEKYFLPNTFAERSPTILQEVIQASGFSPAEELFSGRLYDKDKVWSVVHRGTWKGKPAVLKIQGLPLEMEEYEIHERFAKQNTSEKIRLPEIFVKRPWNETKGYSFCILESIQGERIYSMPFANEAQMDDFLEFYREYKAHCVSQPWF